MTMVNPSLHWSESTFVPRHRYTLHPNNNHRWTVPTRTSRNLGDRKQCYDSRFLQFHEMFSANRSPVVKREHAQSNLWCPLCRPLVEKKSAFETWWNTRRNQVFRLSPKRMSPFKSAGASVQSTAGSRGVRISVSNAGYTTFRGSVRVLATHSIRQFPLHFSTRGSLCAIRFQTHSTFVALEWLPRFIKRPETITEID
jgi:hypothetical protein